MESYYYSSADSVLAGLGLVGSLIAFAIAICCIVAYFMAISSLVKAAKAKNSPFGAGKLWFIGLFTTPITLGVIVTALPDRGVKEIPPTTY